jgi:O-antigen ligase
VERLIVFALLFLLPTQLAYHFWPQFSYIHGLRVDYLSPAIYLTDILIVFLLPYLIKRIKFKKINFRSRFLIFLFPLALFALLNVVCAQSPITAILKWATVLKLVVLGLYFYSCDLSKLRKTIINALSFSLVTFFLIGLLQFILQRTVGGPFYYLGERAFTFQTPGIALMSLFGKSLMRAYSTFPHPNSFAGFAATSFLIILSFYQPRGKDTSKWLIPVYAVLILSLFITLSLNAIAVSVVLIILYFVLNKYPEIIKKAKMFLPITLIGLSLLFGIFSPVFSKDAFLKETYKERIVLAGYAIDAFSQRPVLGVGLNNFFLATKNTQPPHNIFLVVFAETGILGTLVIFLLLSKLFSLKLNKYLFLALVFVLLTGLFDHYSLTLQQNELILAILLGLSARKVYY